MLVRDGHVEFWIPEEFTDASTLAFWAPGRPTLTIRALLLGAQPPERALEQELADARTNVTAVDPGALVSERSAAFTFDGCPGVLAVVEINAAGAHVFKALCYARTSATAGVRWELAMESAAPFDTRPLEREATRIRESLFLLETARALSPDPARTQRLFGRIGFTLPLHYAPRGTYLFQLGETPDVALAVREGEPPALGDVNYFEARDTLEVLQSEHKALLTRVPGTAEEQTREWVRRRREARTFGARHSAAISDDHLVCRFSLRRSAPVYRREEGGGLFALLLASRPTADFADGLWNRFVQTCSIGALE